MKEEQLKELTFDVIREILLDPFRVLVQEGTWAYICTYGSGTIEVIEEVKINKVALNFLVDLAEGQIVFKDKCENIKSDIPNKACFYDIWRHGVYSEQSDYAYDIASTIGLAEAK